MSKQLDLTKNNDAQILEAGRRARATFKYFWRELSWERRRLIPGLDMYAVKLPFSDKPNDPDAWVELMWVTDLVFDGIQITGTLLNAPDRLKSVKEGDKVSSSFDRVCDWMMASRGVVFGAFTVQVLRKKMKKMERQQHDEAWGLKFGDPDQVRIDIEFDDPKYQGEAKPSGHVDHPMCRNCAASLHDKFRKQPTLLTDPDPAGLLIIHREALAGNLVVIQALIDAGVDPLTPTPDGRTPKDLAAKMGWRELAAMLPPETNLEEVEEEVFARVASKTVYTGPLLPEGEDFDIEVDPDRVRKYDSYWRAETRLLHVISASFLLLLCLIVGLYCNSHWIIASLLLLPLAFAGLMAFAFRKIRLKRPDQAFETFDGRLAPGLIIKTSPLTIVVLGDLRNDAVEPRYGVQSIEIENLPDHSLKVGERVPCCLIYAADEDESDYWGNFEAQPVCWATDDQEKLAELKAAIAPWFWEKLEAASRQPLEKSQTTYLYDPERDQIEA